MGFGGFLPINHALPATELWQNASIMHWVKSANSGKRVDQ
jgi:hypothetical protein